MAKLTPGNKLYFYQLFSTEIGFGKQVRIDRVGEVLAEADVLLDDVECDTVEELLAELSEFIKLTVFKGGRRFATVLASAELEAAIQKAEELAADKKAAASAGKAWKHGRASKVPRPAKPRHKRKPKHARIEPEPEAPATMAEPAAQLSAAEVTEPVAAHMAAPVPEPTDVPEAAPAVEPTDVPEAELAVEDALQPQADAASAESYADQVQRGVEAAPEDADQALAEAPAAEPRADQTQQDDGLALNDAEPAQLDGISVVDGTEAAQHGGATAGEDARNAQADTASERKTDTEPETTLAPLVGEGEPVSAGSAGSKPAVAEQAEPVSTQPDPAAPKPTEPEPANEPSPAPIEAPTISLTITYDPSAFEVSAEDVALEGEPLEEEELSEPGATEDDPRAELPHKVERRASMPRYTHAITWPELISTDVFCPNELLLELYQVLPPSIGLMDALDEGWEFAREAATHGGTRTAITFPLSRRIEGNPPIEVTIRRAARLSAGKHWRLTRVDTGLEE